MTDKPKPPGITPEDAARLASAAKAAQEAAEPIARASKASRAIVDNPQMQEAFKRIQDAAALPDDLAKRMRAVSEAHGGSLAKVAEQIAKQGSFIREMPTAKINRMAEEALRPARVDFEPVRTGIHIPPVVNPAHETNSRLESIEDKFDEIHAVARNAAEIANGLQGAAAEFLGEFKTAAARNDSSATKAIWLGAMAVGVALIAALGQIAYTEWWRVPADSAAMQTALDDMKQEITLLRSDQAAVMEQLGETIAGADSELAQAIRGLIMQMEGDAASRVPEPAD